MGIISVSLHYIRLVEAFAFQHLAFPMQTAPVKVAGNADQVGVIIILPVTRKPSYQQYSAPYRFHIPFLVISSSKGFNEIL